MVRSLVHIAQSTVRAGGRRSALVAALIAVGVAAGVGTNVIGRSAAASPSLERHQTAFPAQNLLDVPSGAALDYFGAADARIDWWGPPRDLAFLYNVTDDDAAWWMEMEGREGPAVRQAQARDLTDMRHAIDRVLPSTARTVEFVEGIVPGHGVVVTTADLTSPLVSGMFEPLDRQRAARGDQVLMSATAMAKFNAQIGDRITVPGVGQIHIAGRVRDPGDWSRAVMVVAAEPDQLALVGQRHSWLVGGVPVNGRDRVVERIRRELDSYARASAVTAADTDIVAAGEITSGFANGAAEPPRGDGQLWGRSPVPGALGTAAVLIVIAVFAVAAFAVDHRRRVRHTGVLVAVGATPSQIASVASFEALLIGAAGAVLGAAAGIVGAMLAQPLAERWLEQSIIRVTIRPLDVVVPALLGPLAAVLAARRPARAAARVTVVDAFRGRPPAPRLGSRLPIGAVAALVIAVPVVWWLGRASAPAVVVYVAAVVVFSVARTLTGLLALAPRFGGRAPLLVRLAIRAVGRQQARTGVVVGALAVLVAAEVSGFAMAAAAPARAVVLATGIVVLLALLVVVPTSALGAVESDPDVCLVVAIGAAPALRRRFLGLEAGAQALMASLIGIPAGLLTAVLWMRELGRSGVAIPWIAASMIAIGLPVAVGAIVALVSRALPVQPPTRRIT